MKNNFLKFNILLILTLLLFSANSAFAGHDVVRALTIESEDKVKKDYVESYEIPTANDPDLPNFSEDTSVAGIFKNKIKNRKKRGKDKEILEEGVNDSSETQAKSSQKEPEIKDDNKFQVNADKITYDDNTGNLYAQGHVEIIAKAKNVTLKAKEAELDKASQSVKLKGDVKILQNGLEMAGDSMVVDLSEENVLMDNPVAEAYEFKISAQEAYIIANDLQMLNGNVSTTNKKTFALMPKRFYRYAPGAPEDLYDPKLERDTDVDRKKTTYRIDSKEIVINFYKDHNSLLFKGADVYHNKHKVLPRSDFEVISDKDMQIVETNMLEIGTLRTFGTYVGYGFVNKLPKGQLLKLMPALVYGDSNFGVGLIGRHRSKNSMLEMGYSTSTEKLVARGIYRFGNGFTLRYGRNSYISEGFMGARRSGYAGQLSFEKAYHDKEHGITFRHGTYAGLFSDFHKTGYDHYFATTRFRHTLELNKEVLQYKNNEQDLYLKLSVAAQGSATVYGTGDTMGVFRVGPVLRSKLKSWESSISYLHGGIHGDSPFIFDKYRYGRSTIILNEKYNFNNVFALGGLVAITPNKDNYKHEALTEAMFYALFGPKDFKIALAYDFVREAGYLDFMFILGSDNTKINFDKLTTKNMDRSEKKKDFYKKAKKVKIEDI